MSLKRLTVFFLGMCVLCLSFVTEEREETNSLVIEADWFETMQLGLKIDEYIAKHSTIMDRYDPEKRVGMIVDEWGAWYLVEQGTNPGFLYQQSTLRDALLAGLNLNIFNAHCERVQMANLAQTINVLQSLILTQDENIVLTPTYHVFDMYQVHQDAIMLPVRMLCRDYVFEEEKIPCLNVSASRDEAGNIHVSLCNFDPNKDVKVICELRDYHPKSLKGQVLTAGRINAFNTIENPDEVKPEKFDAFSLKESFITITLPAKSVVVIEIIPFSPR